jgi:para-nitrobenzyl esterase
VLLASPLARGLFAGAIMESGGCVVPIPTAVRGESNMQIAASGCTGAAGGEIACLRAKTPEELLTAYPPELSVVSAGSAFQPYVDGRVLLAQPSAVIASGEHNRVPFIVGANANETSMFAPRIPDETTYQQILTMQYGPALAARILAVYPASDYATPRAAYVAVTSDARFICTSRRDARAAVAGQTEPVFRYFFAQGLMNAPRLSAFGAYHGVELFFVFGNVEFAGYMPSPSERALASMIGGYWTELAASGDVNDPSLPEWDRYESGRDLTLVMTATATQMVDGIRTSQCDFWDSL